MDAPPPQQTTVSFPAELRRQRAFRAGAQLPSCPYCGTTNEIAAPVDARVEEIDFVDVVANLPREELVETLAVRCNTCGAETSLKPNVTAARCPFCGSAIVAQAMSRRLIKPKALLPFHVTHDQAGHLFKEWIGSRWFAPNELRERAERSDITAVHALLDLRLRHHNPLHRAAGDDYYVTESYTVHINGRSARRTRQVRKTRWSYASGTVYNHSTTCSSSRRTRCPRGTPRPGTWD